MAFEKGRKFSTGTSVHRKRQMSTLVEREGHFGPALTVCIPNSRVVFIIVLPSSINLSLPSSILSSNKGRRVATTTRPGVFLIVLAVVG